MASGESRTVILAAITANFCIACAKFIGAALSGSASMISEGIHSLVDTGNGGLLLLGQKSARRPPDNEHPFGYGKSLYFYTLIVAILIFGLGGGLSIYEGINHALHAEPMATKTITLLGLSFSNLALNYAVLLIAVGFEGYAWITALRTLLAQRNGRSLWRTIRQSKDPATFTVLFEDSAALAGLALAILGLTLAHQLNMPIFDGLASIGIGLILCITASLLIWETKGLLLGESIEPEERQRIRELIATDNGVDNVVRIMTMHLGPREVLMNLELQFRTDLSAGGVEATVDRVERLLREQYPQVRYIFVEAESLAASRRLQQDSREP